MDCGPGLAAGALKFDTRGIEGGYVHGVLQASESLAALVTVGDVIRFAVCAQGLAEGHQAEKFGVKVFHVPPPGGCVNG